MYEYVYEYGNRQWADAPPWRFFSGIKPDTGPLPHSRGLYVSTGRVICVSIQPQSSNPGAGLSSMNGNVFSMPLLNDSFSHGFSRPLTEACITVCVYGQ